MVEQALRSSETILKERVSVIQFQQKAGGTIELDDEPSQPSQRVNSETTKEVQCEDEEDVDENDVENIPQIIQAAFISLNNYVQLLDVAMMINVDGLQVKGDEDEDLAQIKAKLIEDALTYQKYAGPEAQTALQNAAQFFLEFSEIFQNAEDFSSALPFVIQ